MGHTIFFNNADRATSLGFRTKLKSFINKQCLKEGVRIETLHYVFCSDAFVLDINNRYLNHNFYTDITSFALSEEKDRLVGDAYISVDRVKENAKTEGNRYAHELLRVIFHGALHFCGYKDKKPAEVKMMRSMEDKWLKAYLKMIGS